MDILGYDVPTCLFLEATRIRVLGWVKRKTKAYDGLPLPSSTYLKNLIGYKLANNICTNICKTTVDS